MARRSVISMKVATTSTNVVSGGLRIWAKIDARQTKKATQDSTKRTRRCGARRLARPCIMALLVRRNRRIRLGSCSIASR